MVPPDPRRTRPARTRVVRRIAADPTSTALLLAGPAAVELWPGVRRVAEVGGRTLVESDPGTAPVTAASVKADPPRRTPTAYVSRFEWSGPGLPSATGTLTLAYAPSPDGTLGTHAALELDCSPSADSHVDVQALAEAFLVNLARAAEQRARAA